MRIRLWVCGSVAVPIALTGCGGGGEGVAPPPSPAAIAVSSGNGQTGPAGAALPGPLRVRVTSASGAGLENITVAFNAAPNSGSASPATSLTDADGLAATTWTLGTAVGANLDTVRASVSGVSAPAVFTASVVAAAPASLAAASGNAQTGTAGQPLPQPLVVVARDRFGNPKDHVDVSWIVVSGGGTLSNLTGTTGADGQTRATWTLGNAGTHAVEAAASGLAGSPVTFTATLNAAGSQLGIVAGNNQTGAPGQLLAVPLVVSLKTQAGAAVVGIPVGWAVTAGGGTLSQTTTSTDGQGRSSATWTLGPAPGAQAVTVTVQGATGSPATFGATATTPPGVVTLTAVSPATIVEGQGATLTGVGFSATPGDNDVTIGGIPANVTAASSTSLSVSVPVFDCQPARGVAVQVRVGGEASNVLTQTLNPSSFTSVAVGQQLVLQNPAEFCLQFAASAAPEDYLIGVQSTSEVASLTPVRVSSVSTSATIAAVTAPLRIAPSIRNLPSRDLRRDELWNRHGAAEATLLARDRILVERLRAATLTTARRTTKSVLAIPGGIVVGDELPLRIRDDASGSACNYIEITAIVRVVGVRGIWLEDVANPSGGYTLADFESMSAQLDAPIYETDVDYFGSPTDLDSNDRIAVVITKEVNRKRTLLGFVSPLDLISRASCSSSNEGEIFYGAAPDPSGLYALGPYGVTRARGDAPFLIAHEFTHIIQVSRRLYGGSAPLMAPWTMEGQATLAEEVVGHVVEGRASNQNLGFSVAFNLDDPASTDWYSDRFRDLTRYYGLDSESRKVAGAPEECSWLTAPPDDSGPCLGGRNIYGTPWSLLRWISDHFGPTHSGGEKGLQRDLIDDSGVGYENIENIAGVPIRTLLAQWAAALYVDDRVPGAATRLTLPSWDLFDIFDHSLPESSRLVPRSRSFSSFTDAFSVRAGSSAYFRVSGATHGPTAIRVRNSSAGQLPSIMQVFVVRLQ